MAVLVQPHSWSHHVYCVPATPEPVAMAAAGMVEVLWQPHEGSQTVTVTIGAGAAVMVAEAEIRMSPPVAVALGIGVPISGGFIIESDIIGGM